MFYILSKTLYYLVMPLTWVMLLLGLALLTRHPRRRKRILIGTLALVFILGHTIPINELYAWWERPGTPYAALDSTYDVAIVLGGVTNGEQRPDDRVHFGRGADRVMHTVQLYKLGKVRHILLSGGGRTLDGKFLRESENMRDVMLLCGVPDSVITVETQSVNTRENALYSAAILQRRFPGQRYLLVSSAFHLRRAEACFRKVGIQADPFATDFHSSSLPYSFEKWIAPTEQAFAEWGLLIHEMVGYVVYKLIGYA
ncbi:Uncharacterized SAM-binding protein YcdF, DUF218 family [Catalinimonas alkaloidigena]|uniref:Uncharacterized SAM-binding protein YcdF, DUF218 family n=1 Tax=Catalinimonas alkaloidigena TaxID=1075417 RepID=A0A1G9N9R7_9BACT|nr:YdcF family protein [Catalinimonas alkaloidigena]SDL83143.1 Uncharacterized SAM-binding protein YcdF, DUF218 family [Catalinimonas alkaloidigena]